jgi:hypothetical protein
LSWRFARSGCFILPCGMPSRRPQDLLVGFVCVYTGRRYADLFFMLLGSLAYLVILFFPLCVLRL